MSWPAIFSADASGLDRRVGSDSISLRGTTSSANRIVDIASAPSRGLIAARYCLLRMSTELEGLAKDLRGQLTTPGTEGRTTVADILGNANTAIQQLQKTGGEFEQLAHDVRGQLTTPGAAGSPTIADVLREGTTTLQRIQSVGTDFEGLVANLRKQMLPGAEGHKTVADVLDRGAVTIDQLNKTASEFEQFAHDLRTQLTTPDNPGSATVADLVQQGKATLERIQGMTALMRASSSRGLNGFGR